MAIASRLTDAVNTISADTGKPLASCQVEYPACSPFNAENTLILILEVSYFGLYEVASKRRIAQLLHVNASSEPRWHLTDPKKFYYHIGNQLLEYDITTRLDRIVNSFTQYNTISANGESELGEDGDSLVLAGDGAAVFVYRISTGSKTRVLNTSGWDAVSLSPDGKVILSAGYLHLFSPGMDYLRQLTRSNGHRHCARDINGKEYLVWDNSSEPLPRIFDQHAIVKIDLENGQQSKLMELGWEFATHITAPMGPLGWCIVSTYDNKSGGDLWRVYLDGRAPEHLIKHGSDSSTYEGQPHASVSRDGKLLAYNVRQNGITDVYLAELESGPLPAPKPESLTLHHFPNQTTLTAENFPALPGQMGTVYDGGTDIKIIVNDGTHKWFIPMTQIK